MWIIFTWQMIAGCLETNGIEKRIYINESYLEIDKKYMRKSTSSVFAPGRFILWGRMQLKAK